MAPDTVITIRDVSYRGFQSRPDYRMREDFDSIYTGTFMNPHFNIVSISLGIGRSNFDSILDGDTGNDHASVYE